MELLRQPRVTVPEIPLEHSHTPELSFDRQTGFDFPSLVRTLWRHKWLILTAVLTPAVFALIVVLQMPSIYQARATVVIDSRGGANVVDIESVTQDLPVFRNLEQVVNSEIKVLTSQPLSERVVDSVGLGNHPEFNPALLETADRRSWPWSIIRAALRPSNAGSDEADLMPGERAARERLAVLEKYAAALSVVPVPRSFAISVRFDSQDPVLAASVANSLADTYIRNQVESKAEATRKASAWLQERVDELRREVLESERRVESFRAQNGLVQSSTATIVEQQLNELNSELVAARAILAEREAVIQQVLSLVEDGDIQFVAGIFDSGVVATLKAEEAELVRRVAELRSEFGPRHPLLINATAELAEIRDRTEVEIARLVESARSKARVAAARVATLEADVRQLEDNASDVSQSEVQLRSLERDAAAARSLLETFLTRLKETQDQAGLQQADARVVSYAEIPTKPSSPNRRLIVFVAVMIGSVLALLIVAIIEQFERGVRSADQVQSQFGLPSLGLVPSLPRRVVQKLGPSRYILERSTSSFAESLRTLRTGLLLFDREAPPKTVLFTSALPGEGKTTTAISLAQQSATNGERVLLIDCDNRRPSVYSQLKAANEPGLVEYLEGQASSLFNVLGVAEESRLNFVTAGREIANFADLLRSEQFAYFLKQVRERYDLVILDSAPVLSVAEPRILASMCDATVFVAKWGDTRREAVRIGLQQIADAGSRIAGVVLAQVDVKKHAAYAFSDSGYYYGNQGSYYTD